MSYLFKSVLVSKRCKAGRFVKLSLRLDNLLLIQIYFKLILKLIITN